MEGDRKIRERGDRILDRVRNEFRAGRHGHIRESSEGESFVGCGIAGCGCRIHRFRNMDCGEMNGLSSECVGDVDSERGTSGRKVEDLADGGILEIVGGQRVGRFGDLLRGGPGDDPDRLLLTASGQICRGEEEGDENKQYRAATHASLGQTR